MLSHFHREAKITINPRFVVKYLGCCDAALDEDTEEDFHVKLTEIQQNASVKLHDLNKMIMTITERGMSIKCPKFGKEYFFPVHRIGSCGRDETVQKALMFTYKPHDWKTHLECHAVLCTSKEVSLDIKDAIAWMFKAATLTQKHRKHDQELSQSKPTQSMTPPLKRKQKPPLNRATSVL